MTFFTRIDDITREVTTNVTENTQSSDKCHCDGGVVSCDAYLAGVLADSHDSSY